MAYVPADFRKTVVFLGKDIDGQPSVCGSAFWIINVQSSEELAKKYRPAYLVTASHVIEEMKQRMVRTVRIRVNLKAGGAKWLEGVSIDRWKEHPDATVDMSILKLGIHEDWDHEGWPTTAFVTPESIEQYHEEIELGDEVFSVGLFWPHKGKTRNIPLVRIGNIAALRDERVETKQDLFSDVYLIEARSVGGLSGAPVFIDIVRARLTGREITTSGNLFVGPFRFRLIGLLSGHFTGVDDELVSTELVSTGISTKELEKLNMGIAYVTPADKLFEGLRQFKGEEEEESRHYRETGSLSIEVGDTTPRENVSSQLATSTVDISETKGKKN